MGLDLYAGPLTRYYSGNWQTVMQELGAQIVYADGHTPWVSQEEAERRVRDFHVRLSEKLAPHDYVLPQWNEAPDHAYQTDKPDHMGREALLLWTAYLQRPDLKRPMDLPSDFETDRAYREAGGEAGYYEPHLLTLESHIFVPAEVGFSMVIDGPLGNKQFVSSTQDLMVTLMWINERSWDSNSNDAEEWLARGLPHDEIYEFRTAEPAFPLAKILGFGKRKVSAPRDKLQQAAQFGFACYAKMLTFSLDNNVPIVTDM